MWFREQTARLEKYIYKFYSNSIQAKSESRNNSKICLHPVRKDDRLNRSNERYDNKKNENGGIWTRIDERTDE